MHDHGHATATNPGNLACDQQHITTCVRERDHLISATARQDRLFLSRCESRLFNRASIALYAANA